jgi:hypothetical protein
MICEGQFDEKGRISFPEIKPKPPDVRHLQGAMFLDRPDLWRRPAKKVPKSKRPLPNQPALEI